MKKAHGLIIVLALSTGFQPHTAHAGAFGDGLIRFGKWIGGSADEAADATRNTRPNTPPTTSTPRRADTPPAVAPNGQTVDPGSRITVENFNGTIAKEIQPNANLQGLDSFARSVSDVLMRTVKAAAIIVAPAGTGKSALAEHLVHMIRTENRSVRNLHGSTVYNLDVKAIIGDTKYSGELERRLVEFRKLLDDLKDEKVVFVVDELEEVLNSELGRKFLTDLKPYFTQEMGVKFIFNITPGPYNELMTDPQLVRRMFKLVKEEPDDFIVKNILRHMKTSIYKKHGVRLKSEDLERIFRLSKKHPELKNPDVAVTILGDAVLKSVADATNGDARIIALKTEVEKIRGMINEIQVGRAEGTAKYDGPFFDAELNRLEEKAVLNEKIINNYDENFEAANELREQMLAKIQERAALYEEAARKQATDDLGDLDPEIMIDQLSSDIDGLAGQIREINKLLTAGEVKDNHIIDAAAAVLGRDKAYVREVMFGGQTIESLTEAIRRRARMAHKTIEAIATRVLTKTKISMVKKPQHFIVVSEDANAVHEFAGVFAENLTGVSPMHIAGTSIKKPEDISSVVGSTAGHIGSDSEGALHAYQKETAGNMVVYVSDINHADKSLQDVIGEVVSTGVHRSNSDRLANFEDTVIVSNVRGIPGLTDAQKAELDALGSETERQLFYRNALKENFTDANPLSGTQANRIDDAVLDSAHIIYAQTDKLSDTNVRSLVAERLRGETLQRAFQRKLQMDIHFSDNLVDYLYNIVKQVGSSNADEVVENDIMPQLLKLLEEGKIVAGDQVTIDIAENGSFIARPAEWANQAQRELAIAANLSDMARVRNAGEATDEVDAALEALDGFL